MSKVERALLSVSDKSGIVELARALAAAGVQIISTGGTARLLEKEGVKVTEVSAHTGFAEMLDGRVKTLHPKIHGGLLARRDDASHLAAIRAAGIEPIDLVVVNLYPFAATVADPDCRLEDAIENIDIGGPAMLRSAAKNYGGVAVVVDPADYAKVLAELKGSGGVSATTRFALAKKAFAHTAAYDGAIANYLTSRESQFPDVLTVQLHKLQDLRYGENPHQSAAFYRDAQPVAGALARCKQVQGKELSYNNIADADAAWECAKSFTEPACVIVKHANPCGVALGANLREAYARAFATDPVSAFGGILAFNRALDRATAEAVGKQFAEVIIAPRVEADAQKVFASKANLRVLEVPLAHETQAHEYKRIGGGLLVQSTDAQVLKESDLKVPTQQEADAAADAGPSVRLARGEVREVQRHRLRPRPRHPGHRRRPDEPPRQRTRRGVQGAGGEARARGLGGGLRRILPVPRRSRCACRGRCHGGDPARRQREGRRGHRGCG